MTDREELAQDIPKWTDLPFGGGDGYVKLDANAAYAIAGVLIEKGYRKIFDGECGLSNVKAPDDREAAEAWMRWANLAMNDEIGAIGAMKQMLTELGYRKDTK